MKMACGVKKSDKLGGKGSLRGEQGVKKGKAFHKTCLHKVACSLQGDTGFLIARPTVVGWFVYDMT